MPGLQATHCLQPEMSDHPTTLTTSRRRKRTAANEKVAQSFFVALYVVPFYLFRKTRPSPTLNRDAPNVIKARIRSVTLTVVISTLTTLYLLHMTAKLSLKDSSHYLGLYPIGPLSIIKSLTLTLVLYLAPLYETLYIERELSPLSTLFARLQLGVSSSQGYRNYVAGPFTEEMLWRSTLIPLHLLAQISAQKVTFLTPLYFGIAHVHHFYEFYLTHPHTPLLQALFRSIFQFAYTTIFGWYASFVYLRTGNLYAVFFIHTFCNRMGLPRLYGKVKPQSESRFSSMAISKGKANGNVDVRGRGQSGPDLVLLYTVVYYTLLGSGAYGFYRLLFPLTDGAVALASFDKS